MTKKSTGQSIKLFPVQMPKTSLLPITVPNQHHSSKLKSKESRTAIFINKLSKGRTNPMPFLFVYKNLTVTHARFTAPEIITIQYNKSLLLQYTAIRTNCQAEFLQYKIFVFMEILTETCRPINILYSSIILL
jgi:hypothetical protein